MQFVENHLRKKKVQNQYITVFKKVQKIIQENLSSIAPEELCY